MPHGDVSFMHPKHMLLWTVIEIHRELSYSLNSGCLKFILSIIASILKNQSLNFPGFTAFHLKTINLKKMYTCCKSLHADPCFMLSAIIFSKIFVV